MIAWPDELISDVARRRSVLFLGAGISMNSFGNGGVRPKNWNDLLAEASMALDTKPKKVVRALLKKHDFLTACEVVKAELGKDPYETFLTKEFLEPQFQPAPVHDTLFKLDSRIVATPNIDKIYETRANHLANGSVRVKHYYDDDIADAIRRPHRLVLKVHGTIDTPARMIFTRREYASARMENAEFYSILDALVITHTFVFLGCGVSDPDIRLILENYAFRFRNSRRHFMTLPKEGISPQERQALEDSLNLKFLSYSSKNGHQELRDSIENLLVMVEAKRNTLSGSMDW